MCTIHKGFKFCTCSDLSKAEYTWRLTRYLGEDTGIHPVGSIVGPARDLGQGITEVSILEVLNGGKGFDFDYAPAEMDSLRIVHNNKEGYWYMSFLFSKGKWERGMNAPFSSLTEEIATGEVDI